MAFDITTARPEKQGFDLSTAQPEQSEQQLQPDFAGGSVIEPVRAIASGLARTVGGGLAGLGSALVGGPEAGAQTVQDIQAGAFQPTTEAGQEGLQSLMAALNTPGAGLAGLVELASSGFDLNKAVAEIDRVQKEGLQIGPKLGEATLEATGSPGLATAVETGVTGLELAAGAKIAPKAIKTIASRAEQAGEITGTALEATKPAIRASEISKTASDLFAVQSPAKQKIAQLLTEGARIDEAAPFALNAPHVAQSKIGKALGLGGPTVKSIPAAEEAIKQGWDKGVITSLRRASKADKLLATKMVNIAERVTKDKEFGLLNRPTDISGDVLMGRIKTIQTANRNAGKIIDKAAQSLKGQSVDVTDMSSKFFSDLEGMGIKLNPDRTLDFKGSDIEFAGGPKSTIRNVVKRMADLSKSPVIDKTLIGEAPSVARNFVDGKVLHDLKRLIDTEVTYGKSIKGLTAGPERALKEFRANIKEALNTQFPKYGKANTVYSETISALDAMQKVAGNKMNLLGENANKATGTLMRRIMGNAQSRINLLEAVEEIEAVAKRHGVFTDTPRIKGTVGEGLENNLLVHILFADEIDAVIGPAARTSLQGQFDQTIRSVAASTSKTGAINAGVELGLGVFNKIRGINQAGAFKSIKKLLKTKQ